MNSSIQPFVPNITRAETIDGWMLHSELEWLANTASRANTIIEVGSYKGRSTRALCDSTPGIVYAVDPFYEVYYNNENKQVFEIGDKALKEFHNNLEDHLFSGKLVHFQTVLRNIPTSIVADFIFIDGDHRYYSVVDDINAALKRLRAGGVLSGHDYGDPAWPGVKMAVDEIAQTLNKKINTANSIWWMQI